VTGGSATLPHEGGNGGKEGQFLPTPILMVAIGQRVDKKMPPVAPVAPLL